MTLKSQAVITSLCGHVGDHQRANKWCPVNGAASKMTSVSVPFMIAAHWRLLFKQYGLELFKGMFSQKNYTDFHYSGRENKYPEIQTMPI